MTAINLVTFSIKQKPKGKNVSKWKMETPEMVYKERFEDHNQDMYLMLRIRRLMKFKDSIEFVIAKVNIVKFIGYGTSES